MYPIIFLDVPSNLCSLEKNSGQNRGSQRKINKFTKKSLQIEKKNQLSSYLEKACWGELFLCFFFIYKIIQSSWSLRCLWLNISFLPSKSDGLLPLFTYNRYNLHIKYELPFECKIIWFWLNSALSSISQSILHMQRDRNNHLRWWPHLPWKERRGFQMRRWSCHFTKIRRYPSPRYSCFY